MLYGSKCWPVDKKIEQRLSAAKTRMLRWMNVITRKDKIRNECVKGSIGVASIVDCGEDEGK